MRRAGGIFHIRSSSRLFDSRSTWLFSERGNRLLAVSMALILGILSGCAENRPAPIEDRNGSAYSRAGKTPRYTSTLAKGKPYTVKKGDTLYQIAFRLGMDFKALAKRNNIAEPYTIFPGQILQTNDSKSVAKASSGSSSASTTSKSTSVPSSAVSKTTPSTSSAAKAASSAKSPVAPKATPPSSTSSQSTSNRSQSVTKASPPSSHNSTAALGPVSRWLWPTAGKVQRTYSSVLHKGVDIAGKRGDPVKATAPGVVVYSGTGVKGYGALLIVKHNDQFLSAYGHNDAILVKEGDSIAAGQQIAQMGSSGTDSVKLHFEIRRQGKPVDPLRLLPKR